LQGESPYVFAHAFTSPTLSGKGVKDLLDELRVTIVDEANTTAYFTFSSTMRPVLNQFRIFGSRNALVLHETQQSLVKLRGSGFKSYVERFVPPVIFAQQHIANAARNVRLFMRNELHMDAGKKTLIEAFYRSIVEKTAVPIPYSQILLTARVMDAIFAQ